MAAVAGAPRPLMRTTKVIEQMVSYEKQLQAAQSRASCLKVAALAVSLFLIFMMSVGLYRLAYDPAVFQKEQLENFFALGLVFSVGPALIILGALALRCTKKGRENALRQKEIARLAKERGFFIDEDHEYVLVRRGQQFERLPNPSNALVGILRRPAPPDLTGGQAFIVANLF